MSSMISTSGIGGAGAGGQPPRKPEAEEYCETESISEGAPELGAQQLSAITDFDDQLATILDTPTTNRALFSVAAGQRVFLRNFTASLTTAIANNDHSAIASIIDASNAEMDLMQRTLVYIQSPEFSAPLNAALNRAVEHAEAVYRDQQEAIAEEERVLGLIREIVLNPNAPRPAGDDSGTVSFP